MKNFSVKTIVAIGIGAALFFVLSTYVAIPTPIPNLKVSVHYPVIAVMAMLPDGIDRTFPERSGKRLGRLVELGCWFRIFWAGNGIYRFQD